MKFGKVITAMITFIFTIYAFVCPNISALSFGFEWSSTPRTVLFTCNMDSIGEAEVQAAMDGWNAITVNGSTPVNMELTNNSSANSVDYEDSFSTWIGFCDISHSTTEIFSVNVDLNTFWYDFSAGAVSDCYDVQSIVLHELGHGLGIKHCHEAGETDPCWSATCNSNVMYRIAYTNCTKRTLQPYDYASYQIIYW